MFVWIYIHITPQMLKSGGAKEEELEGLSSYLSTVRGKVKVAAVLKEGSDGTTRVSIRSNPGVDVANIAKRSEAFRVIEMLMGLG